MIKSISMFIVLGILAPVGLGATAEASSPKDVPRMTQEQAKSMLGSSDTIIIDVRQPKDWDASDSKIKGAIKEDPSKISAWADKYSKNKTLIFYCA